MNVDEKVGRNIRKYRMAYNMTLKELAVRLHKSVSTVSKYEDVYKRQLMRQQKTVCR